MSSLEEPPQSSALNWSIASRYVAVVAIWSSTPLAVAWSIRELHPVWALACRFVLAAPLAYVVLLMMKQSLRLDRVAIKSYAAGGIGLWGAMLCCYLGAGHLPSAMISVLFGLSPLFAGFLGHAVFRTQKLAFIQWIGMMLGMLGMAYAMGLSQGELTLSPVGVGWILLGVLLYVVSMFAVQRTDAGLHPMTQTTGSLILSAVGMALMLPLFWADRPLAIPDAKSLIAIGYSVVMASVVAMLCYFDLVQKIKPTTVALSTLMTPIFAMLLGYLLNHESFASQTLWGLLVVLLGLGCYFAQNLRPQSA